MSTTKRFDFNSRCFSAVACFAGLILAFVPPDACAAPARRPNLLFIITDQQRFDAMSCAGNTVIETPNMDRIAREGVMFSNCYSANPVCVPARASILTGLSSVNVNVLNNGDLTSSDVPEVPTFDRVLKQNGYAAEYYGKWHTPHQFTDCYNNDVKVVGNVKGAPSQIKAYQVWLESKGVTPKTPGEGELYSGRNKRPYRPIELDLDYDKATLGTAEKMKLKSKQVTQYGEVDLPPRVSYAAFTADETLQALDRLKDQTFTLTCSFDPPHPPMVVQEPYYGMYPAKSIPMPPSIDDPMTDSPYRERANQDDQLRYRNGEQIQGMRSIYYGMVREIDDWIGEILNKLDALGLTENTLVVFISDHGEMLGDHGMHSKMIFYEGSVHVPFLMRFPGRITPGTVVDVPVSQMDVCSTVLDYMGVSAPENNGISLRFFVEGQTKEHDVVSFSSGTRTPNYMIRSGDLKLMMGKDKSNRGLNALYNLKADPQELRNLILTPISPEGNRVQAEQMKERLVEWMKKHEPQWADDLAQRKLY